MPEQSPLHHHLQTIQRYLERYAEPEALSLPDGAIKAFDSIIVIPVFDEEESVLECFLEFRHPLRILMIWVFNVPEGRAGTAEHQRTQALRKRFLLSFQAKLLSENCYLADIHADFQLLMVDRTRHLIPDKQGVGLARKIGADLALQLSYRQYLQSGRLIPWIYSTDADVRLPEGYAMLTDENKALSACIYPFVHRTDAVYLQAMSQYEFSLHYYVDRLASAGSPYAFHTIGSLIAFTPLAYAQVRGFPKRAGAEDFYLLNKLAKVGGVMRAEGPVIDIAGRPSQRVPFGTGPALRRIDEAARRGEAFRLYHPRIFDLLRLVLNSLDEVEISVAQARLHFLPANSTLHAEEEIRQVNQVLADLGLLKQIPHLRQKKNSEAFRQAFHIWFDAFLTLRFVHEIRDRLYPNINLLDLPALYDAGHIRGAVLDYPEWFETLGISR